MPRKKQKQHKKRSNNHNRLSKRPLKLYLSYLPLVVAITASIVLSGGSPKPRVLSYATNVSISGLLASTNSARSSNGLGALALNQQLDNAAQAKASDMVARNYWSHNTPDGQEPWVFINNAGYQYTKAGENLAYGFDDSDSTINGWMNSSEHRENMLNSSFTEVGFGFANSDNFVSSGPETVVVAMYGQPQVLAATSQAPAPAASTTKKADTSAPTPAPSAPTNDAKKAEPAATTSTAKTEPTSKAVARVQTLSNGTKPWAVFAIGTIMGLSLAAMLLKKGLMLRRYLVKGERFVLHHPLFDSIVTGLIILGITLIQTVGFIK